MYTIILGQNFHNKRKEVNNMEKVILAYSGGLDTTAVIPWLKETYGYEVICCCINCGQGEELDGLEERAQLSGASKLYIEDVVDDLCENYIMPSYRPVQFMSINTLWEQLWQDQPSLLN